MYLAVGVAGALIIATPSIPAGADNWSLGSAAHADASAVVATRALATTEVPRTFESAVVPIGGSHGRLTSAYGYRLSSRSRRRRFHAGVDFDAPRGVRVQNVRAGVVEAVPRNRERHTGYDGYGNAVVVRHDDEGVWVLYAHLQTVAVRPGDRVEAGQLLGTSGRTSNRKFPHLGPHLHLEVRVATPEGETPFPGVYRRYNVNPRCWFARHGLYYDAHGELGPKANAPLARCRQ